MAKRVFNVKKSLGGAKSYRAWKEWKAGDYVIGKYVEKGLDQYEKNNYTLIIEDAQFQGAEDLADSLIEKKLCLNACGSLDKQMEEVEEGMFIKIEYTGTALIAKGKFAGKEAHTTILEILEESEEDSEDGL